MSGSLRISQLKFLIQILIQILIRNSSSEFESDFGIQFPSRWHWQWSPTICYFWFGRTRNSSLDSWGNH